MPRRHWELYEHQHVDVDPKLLEYPPSAPAMGYVSPESPIRFVVDKGHKPARREENTELSRTVSISGYHELIRGYRAGITFLDEQVGRLLDLFDSLKLWNNTIVLLTSDHGMQLGEKGMWQKWTLFEDSTRVPLIIHDPKSKRMHGKRYSVPVESLDIFPTTVDLAGLEYDTKCDGPECAPFEGKSLASIIRGEKRHDHQVDFAITQRITCRVGTSDTKQVVKDLGWSACDSPHKNEAAMGYAMRTSDWRYVAWFRFDQRKYKPIITPQGLFAEELYDHRIEDPHWYQPEVEFESLAHDPKYHTVLRALRAKLLHFLSAYDNWYPKYKEHKAST